MGVAGSVSDPNDPRYVAFTKLISSYESEFKARLASGSMTEEELLSEFKHRFISMVNHAKSTTSTGSSDDAKYEVKDSMEALVEDTLTLNVRGVYVGDVVKVKDEGFYVEGVVVKVDGDMCLVDFGFEELCDSNAEEDYIEGQPETEAHNDEHDKNSTDESPTQESVVARKLFPRKDCILVLPGDEFELGDKVEVKLEGTFLYAVGYIWKIHRRFNPDKSSVEVHYDVCMEGTDDEATDDGLVPATMEDKIAFYEECLLTNKQEELDKLDVEYKVAESDIRKILSGRIKTAERWKSAWRKVQAMIAFKSAGQSSAKNLENP